jgi:hypothetical protein
MAEAPGSYSENSMVRLICCSYQNNSMVDPVLCAGFGEKHSYKRPVFKAKRTSMFCITTESQKRVAG